MNILQIFPRIRCPQILQYTTFYFTTFTLQQKKMLELFETWIFYFPADVYVFKFLSILSSTNPLLSMRKKPTLKLLHVGSLIFDKFSQQADVFDFLNVLPR